METKRKTKILTDTRVEFLAVLVLSVLLVFGVTVIMGTMSSGFHFVDDHEFLEWVYQMKHQNISVVDILVGKVKADFSWRYEPLYYSARILSCYIFGVDLKALSVLKASEIVVSLVFLYYSGRLMGAKKCYALLFSLISMVGYQSAVWWKLGPQEAQCTALFSTGLYCMLRYLLYHKKRWMAASLVLFAAMANYKESFIILMPFLMLYVLYHQLKGEDGLTWGKLWLAIRERLGYLLALGMIFLVPVLVIVFYVGTNNYGAVGLDASEPIGVYIEAISRSLAGDLKWFKRFGVLFGIILLTYYEELKKLWREMLLAAAFLLPQFIIFGRSGIGERYVLPSSIGYAFFFVLVITKWKPLSGRRRFVYVTGLLLLLAAHGRVMLREADYFRYRGESINAMLEAVKEMAGEDTNVLACFRPNEEGNLTINYWLKLQGFDNVYYWDEERKIINKECDINLRYDEEYYEEQSFSDMDIVVMYNRKDRHWAYDLSLDLSDFQEIPCGTLTMYVRNGSLGQMVYPQVEELRINF
ncbi:hypothetical protein IMSAGC019_00821 [Lachnospiraceae bacterium]|nr:hypothetical protein IMSAGC019_00821 [Lachnospiraceae bacterium]